MLELGVLQAVDIFAIMDDGRSAQQFGASVAVCLRARGRLIFLDARQAPRVPARIAGNQANIDNTVFTCGEIPAAGTLVLIAD